MQCDLWEEAISARADGEPNTIDPRLLEAHLSGCLSCRTFAENVHVLRRSASIDLAASVPDLSAHVVKIARANDRGSVWWVLRLGLAVVSAQILVFSVPALLLGHSQGSDEHSARHLGSFAVAYAIGLLVVALRPAKARGMLPLTASLAGCLAVTAIIDIAEGRVPALTEFRHIPEVIGLVLVWVFATPKRLPTISKRTGLPRLHSVTQHEQQAQRTS
ncbi:MAG: zf-HC2 domain-containing protein [Actinomycetota bacterium]